MKTEKFFRTQNLLRCLVLAALPALFLPHISLADAVGEFTVVRGRVDVFRPGVERVRAVPVMPSDSVFLKDIVRTKSRSRARIAFVDGTVLNIAEKSKIEIKEYMFKPEEAKRSSTLRVFRGMIRTVIPSGWKESDPHFRIETPTSVAAVRGTDFFVAVKGPLEARIIVLEGHVAVQNINPAIAGVVVVGPRQMITIELNQPPPPPRTITQVEVDTLINATDAEQAPADEILAEVTGGGEEVEEGSGSQEGEEGTAGGQGEEGTASAGGSEGDVFGFTAPEGLVEAPLVEPEPVVETMVEQITELPEVFFVQEPATTAVIEPPITETIPEVLTTPVEIDITFPDGG